MSDPSEAPTQADGDDTDATQAYTTEEEQTTTTEDTDATQIYATEEEALTEEQTTEAETTTSGDPDATTQAYAETDLFGDVSDDEEKPTEEQATTETQPTETTTTVDDEEQPMPTSTDEGVTQADLFGDLSDDEKETIEPESTTTEDVTALTQADMDEAAAQAAAAEDESDLTASQKRTTSIMKKEKLVAQGETATVQTRPIQGPPREADLLLVKLPNVVGIEALPFYPETYERQLPLEIVEDRLGDRHFNKETNINTPGPDRRVIRLAAENVIRWRWIQDQDGNLAKQSNARIVRWSDGSTQLYLGHEIFDVVERDIENRRNMIFANANNNIWRAQGCLQRTMKFRPLSVSDAAHKKLGDLIAQTHIKQGKLKRQLEPVDIAKQREISEQAAKSADQKEEKARKQREKRRHETQRENKKMDKSFIENEEGEEYDFSMKRDYDSDDERSRRLMRAKSKSHDDDEEMEENEEDDDDNNKRKRKHDEDEPEEDEPVMKKTGKGKRRKLADDEDEASDED